MRKQKGITLIALVVTVIVLLILAGVSITALTDDEKGVVTKAKEAAQKTEDAAADEDEEIEEILEYAESEDLGETVVAGFTITFLILVGGTVHTTIKNATKVSFPAAPSRTGYEFTGWYYDSACTNKATSGDAITADTTLYAGWTEVASDSILETETITNKQNGATLDIITWSVSTTTDLTILQYTTSKEISSCSIIDVNDSDYIDTDYNDGNPAEDTNVVYTKDNFSFVKNSENTKQADFVYLRYYYWFNS